MYSPEYLQFSETITALQIQVVGGKIDITTQTHSFSYLFICFLSLFIITKGNTQQATVHAKEATAVFRTVEGKMNQIAESV